MSKHRARIKKAEQQLQVKEPLKIVVIWEEDDILPLEPGEQRIILTWDDSLEIETS